MERKSYSLKKLIVAKALRLVVVASTAFGVGACEVGEDLSGQEESSLSWDANSMRWKKERVLDMLRQKSGNKILSGQESTLWDLPWNSWAPSNRDQHVTRRTNKTPAVFSTDFGDFKLEDIGSEEEVSEKRAMVVDAAKAHSDEGALVMLSYHMCPPDLPSGCTHEQMGGFSENNRYPDWKLRETLNPGTQLNRVHMERIDEVAEHLKTLQNQGVVVLWRPFHELNRKWFWWGDSSRTAELYRQMHHRMTVDHGLSNLIWVYSANYWDDDAQHPSRYYPGDWHVDMLGIDIYKEHGHEYSQRIYDEMLELADSNQPIAITENGAPPSDWSQFRRDQPNWVFWSTWFGYEGRWQNWEYNTIYGDSNVMSRSDMPRFD